MSLLRAIVEPIVARGRIEEGDVAALRGALPSDGPCSDDDATLLWALHDALAPADDDPRWQAFFVEMLAQQALGGDRVLRSDEADVLVARIQASREIDALELDLMVHLYATARIVPDGFRRLVFEAVAKSIAARGAMAAGDVARVRRIVFEAPTGEGAAVLREEAEFLFALNDAVADRPNDPAWEEVFVDGIKRFLLEDAQSPGVVDEAEAAWLIRRLEADGKIDAAERRLLGELKHHIKHNELWGGYRSDDIQASTSGLVASLFSRACAGGRGGDFYYISVSASDILTRIAVADVMGHGPAVADVSRWIYAALASRINNANGNEILAQLNQLATEHGYRAMTTVALATFARTEGTLSFAYAGHPPMLLRRRADGLWTPVDLRDQPGVANLPLGIDADIRYDQCEISLAAGDRLFLYTDGVVEAPDAGGEQFGIARLHCVLEAHQDAPLRAVKDAVLAALHAHTGGPFTHDDVTFMVVDVK